MHFELSGRYLRSADHVVKNKMVNLIAASIDFLPSATKFPHRVRVQADIKIPLTDGSWLHAGAWIPEEVSTGRSKING